MCRSTSIGVGSSANSPCSVSRTTVSRSAATGDGHPAAGSRTRRADRGGARAAARSDARRERGVDAQAGGPARAARGRRRVDGAVEHQRLCGFDVDDHFGQLAPHQGRAPPGAQAVAAGSLSPMQAMRQWVQSQNGAESADLQALRDLESSGKNFTLAGNLLLVGGSLAALGGAGLMLLDNKRASREQSLSIHPTVSGERIGISLSWSSQ